MASPLKADDLWASWSRNQWKPHYLFTGQEDFLIDEAVQKAVRHWLGEKPDTMSIEKLDVELQSLDDIIQAAQTMPFFGGDRVLIIQNAGQLTSKEQEPLAQVLKNLGNQTHAILIWGKEWRRDDATKPLVEALQALGQVIIFWPMFASQAERWLIERARHYKKTITPPAAHWLIQQSGEGLRLLDQELSKCATFVGARPTLELEDVQTSFGYAKASSPFEWVAAVRRHDSSLALQILDQLLEEGEEPVRLLALISRSLRDWIGAKGSGENTAMLAMRFHIRRGEENRFIQELAGWDVEQLTDALSASVETEESIKSGKETPEMALTLLTLGLCRNQRTYAGR